MEEGHFWEYQKLSSSSSFFFFLFFLGFASSSFCCRIRVRVFLLLGGVPLAAQLRRSVFELRSFYGFFCFSIQRVGLTHLSLVLAMAVVRARVLAMAMVRARVLAMVMVRATAFSAKSAFGSIPRPFRIRP
jgi:hypothetical protein